MIQTETTPNPNSLKFLSEKVISAIAEITFSERNFKELGFGVVSVCIMRNLYYINPTFSRIFLRFSSAIILAFSLPFFKMSFKYDLSLSNFLISSLTGIISSISTSTNFVFKN